MTIDYNIDKNDLRESLFRMLKRDKTIKRTLLIFNILFISAICLIIVGIITKWLWCFIIGVSFLGINAYRPRLRKEALNKLNELEREDKLKTCIGSINLTVENDGLRIRNGHQEEKISASNVINVHVDNKYLTIEVSHGLLIIPVKGFARNDDKRRMIDAIQKMRHD